MAIDEQTPRPAANDEQTDLTALKSLLLGPEQSVLEQLQTEAQDPEVQSGRVADVLPAALRTANAASPRALSQALEQPVSECIENSVQRNPGFFADILYPVMGPAIRRSITQAMKGLVQQINQALEYSLTLKGLRWRLEAARSGIPFAEIVLRRTLRYRVEEAFLIQTGSGLLIQHLGEETTPARDADAVSAMLTAIRDFARDTMDREDPESHLETVDVGDHTLWLIHGPKAYLACAIRGVPPEGLRDELAAVLEKIHGRHAILLDSFAGDTAQAAPIVPLLQSCLRAEAAEPSGRRFPWPLFLILFTLTALLAWWLYGLWQADQQAQAGVAQQRGGVAQIAAAPGIVLTDWRIDAGTLYLRGLHDPLTPAPQQLLAELGFSTDGYRLDFRPFESSDAVAALARARHRLSPPDTIELTLDDDGTLSARGSATASWIARAALLATTVPGVERYSDDQVENPDRLIERRLRESLQPPEGVDIEVHDGMAEVRGLAPLAWIVELNSSPPALEGLAALQTDGLQPLEAQRLSELVDRIEQSRIGFVAGIDLDVPQRAQIESLARLLDEAHQLALQLRQPMQLQIIGRTDGTGSPAQNLFIARERAGRVADALRASAYSLPPLQVLAIARPPRDSSSDAELRRTEFRVIGVARLAAAARAGP